MRVLLDENLPRRLLSLFDKDTDATTVGRRGWKGIKNGELLALAEHEFDVFVTVDRGIEYQQDVGSLDLVVVLLQAPSNSYPALAPLMDGLRATISEISESDEPGRSYPEVIRVGSYER